MISSVNDISQLYGIYSGKIIKNRERRYLLWERKVEKLLDWTLMNY